MPDLYMDVDTALSEVPVNLFPLLDDADFKTIEADVNYNATGLVLVWHFVTTAGAYSQTAVTPTDTGGNYDWVEQGNGMFTIEIPASGGASINNDTEGFGWFTGKATGVLPWRGPVIGFRASGLNDLLIDSAYSTTRGLAGTALPAAAADAAGGLPISDAGGLDLDAQIGTKINDILVDTGTTLQGELDGIQADTEDIQSRLPAALVSGRIDASVGAMAANVLTATAINADAITAAKMAADVTTEIQNGLATAAELAKVPKSDSTVSWNSTALAAIQSECNDALVAYDPPTKAEMDSGLDALPTAAEIKTAIEAAGSHLALILEDTGTTIPGILGTPAGASMSADIAAIEAQTDDIGAAGAGLTAVPWNAAWDAEVQSEVADALAAYGAATATNVSDAAANVSVDEIQTSALADLFNTNSGATYGSAVSGSVVKEIADNAGGSSLTAAGIADAVWDEAISGHLGAGSTGNALNAAGSAGDPWSTPIPGAYGSGTAGKILGDNINATISSRASQTSVDTIDDFLDTEMAAVLADTNELQTDLTNGGRLDLLIDAIKAKTDNLPTDPADQSAVEAAITAATSGLATAAALDTVDNYIDTEMAALTTELAKVPKSDSTVTWNATALASIQSECADALNAYDPPTKAELDTGLDAIPTATENADALLNRDMSAVSDTASRSPLNALRFLRNKWALSGVTLSVKKEDDATEAWNATVSTDAAAIPITGADPS